MREKPQLISDQPRSSDTPFIQSLSGCYSRSSFVSDFSLILVQISILFQVWAFLSSNPSREVLGFCSDTEMFSLLYEKKVNVVSVLVSSLYCCILFSSPFFHVVFTTSFICFLCLPQILPGKPLPPMMFAWWLVRSGQEWGFWTSIFLCLWWCTVLYPFGLGRTVEHLEDANGLSCPDSPRAMLIYTNWKAAFIPSFSPVHQLPFTDAWSCLLG